MYVTLMQNRSHEKDFSRMLPLEHVKTDVTEIISQLLQAQCGANTQKITFFFFSYLYLTVLENTNITPALCLRYQYFSLQ